VLPSVVNLKNNRDEAESIAKHKFTYRFIELVIYLHTSILPVISVKEVLSPFHHSLLREGFELLVATIEFLPF
jgi:hypothetical protein